MKHHTLAAAPRPLACLCSAGNLGDGLGVNIGLQGGFAANPSGFFDRPATVGLSANFGATAVYSQSVMRAGEVEGKLRRADGSASSSVSPAEVIQPGSTLDGLEPARRNRFGPTDLYRLFKRTRSIVGAGAHFSFCPTEPLPSHSWRTT
ncbi:hypothetical protein BH11PSE8_BH11PSE8_29820 [soil metagenome]